jgi:bacillithiol biosynthesis deacetylase BshB1
MNKVDLLVVSAHPDDAEISASGTIIKSVKDGKIVALVDLTQGERGTRGSADLRMIEAQKASEIMGTHFRENLELADCFFSDTPENKMRVIDAIRKYQPEIVFTNSLRDRHPDHARAAKLVADCCFYAGLPKIITNHGAWRPKAVYHFNQDYYNKPDFVVDISEHMEQKIETLKAFSSQFFDPNSDEPNTPISGKEFFDFIKGRALDFGRLAGYKYGEGFVASRPMGMRDVFNLD